jgi:hypothetical protein
LCCFLFVFFFHALVVFSFLFDSLGRA